MSVRAAFYYPWFPETWAETPVAEPSIGRYASSLGVIQNHVGLMQGAKIQAAVSSWWGQNTPYEPRFQLCLDAALNTKFKWCPYYEKEGFGNPDTASVEDDLTFIWDHYVAHPNYLRRESKPVIFVYGAGDDKQAYVQRWHDANKGRFHVVLKLFDGFKTISPQPESWHEYAPANAISDFRPYSISVSPGFAMKDQPVRLSRDLERFRADCRTMRLSNPYWQLFTTFNEHGEGTAIEPQIPYGATYLDAAGGRR